MTSLPLFEPEALPPSFDPDRLLAAWAARTRVADTGHFDEFRDAGGRPRKAWRDFIGHLGAPLEDLGRRHALLSRQILEDGITYNIYGDPEGRSRPWSLELLPLLLGPQDWAVIERGVAQRAALLNAVLVDVYGDQRVLKDALLPSALVLGHPGYLRGLRGVQPPQGLYLHLLAFDLVRGPDGQWCVVSQRTQAPSGLGYVLQNRLIVSRLFPDAFRAMNVQHLASSYRRLLDTVNTLAETCTDGQPPRVALWTPGPYNETYFEHAYLARYLGVPLVEGGDLIVRDDRLYLKTVQGLERLHGLLRRLDDDFCDPLELRADSTLGVPGLLQAVRAGQVVMANALGTGFLESPALHGFLPALSQALLHEPLALPSLPTWWCGERAAWTTLAPELGDKVIRPTFPPLMHVGGARGSLRPAFDAVMGPALAPSALHAWRERIERDAEAYTAQSFVPFPQTPVWAQGEFVMRGASLRVYALADGRGRWQVMPGGMTRIAGREAGPVSMQLGGSSLDTWVMTEGSVDTFSMLPQSLKVDDLALRQRPVSSRTGENLFWMGRYTERVEQQLRLVQCMVSLLDDDEPSDPAVLEALSALGTAFGLVPEGTPTLLKSPRVFERAAAEAMADAAAGQGAYGLAFNLAAMDRLARALRERLSPEHDRLLRAMNADFAARLHPDPFLAGDLASARPALDHLAMQLAAVTGAQSDRMTRDAGWRLLTAGRLLERLAGYAGLLQGFVERQAVHTPQSFDMLMMLFDSAITFRARFQRRLEWPALVATLVLDESNPRALACVVRRLRTELAKLPEQGGPLTALLDLLPQEHVGLNAIELGRPGPSGEAAVRALCARLAESAWRLSDELGLRYFAHAQPTAQTVSA